MRHPFFFESSGLVAKNALRINVQRKSAHAHINSAANHPPAQGSDDTLCEHASAEKHFNRVGHQILYET